MMTGKNMKKTVSVLVLGLFMSGCTKFSYSDVRPISNFPQVSQMSEDGSGEITVGYYEAAKDHLKKNRLGLAIQAFRQDIIENGESVKNLNGLAIAYDQLKRFDVAERFYERALRFEPDSTETVNNLAVSYMRQGDGEKALTLLSSLQPKDQQTTEPVIDYQKRLAKLLTEKSTKSLAQLKNRSELPKGGYQPKLAVKRLSRTDWQLVTADATPRTVSPRVTKDRQTLAPRLRQLLNKYEEKVEHLGKGVQDTSLVSLKVESQDFQTVKATTIRPVVSHPGVVSDAGPSIGKPLLERKTLLKGLGDDVITVQSNVDTGFEGGAKQDLAYTNLSVSAQVSELQLDGTGEIDAELSSSYSIPSVDSQSYGPRQPASEKSTTRLSKKNFKPIVAAKAKDPIIQQFDQANCLSCSAIEVQGVRVLLN